MSDADLANVCAHRALEKMQNDAAIINCELMPNTIEAYFINNKFYNPSKYIGYNAEIKCQVSNSNIFMLVQYDSLTKECM